MCAWRLDQPVEAWPGTYTKAPRWVGYVDGVVHHVIRKVIKLDDDTVDVFLACAPVSWPSVQIDPNTSVHRYGEVAIDCMTCLVRSWSTETP